MCLDQRYHFTSVNIFIFMCRKSFQNQNGTSDVLTPSQPLTSLQKVLGGGTQEARVADKGLAKVRVQLHSNLPQPSVTVLRSINIKPHPLHPRAGSFARESSGGGSL